MIALFNRLYLTALIISFCSGFASAAPGAKAEPTPVSTLLLKTTSGYLQAGQKKLGLATEFGLSDGMLIGTDVPGLAAGALNVYGKGRLWQSGPKELTLGLDLVAIDRETLLWGSQKDMFAELYVRGIHPRLIFSQAVSRRLIVHSSWETGFGTNDMELSESGKRKYWRSKYPNGDYEGRRKDGRPDAKDDSKLVENYSITHRSLLLQSFLGMAQDRFELTGEVLRSPTETLLISAHIAQFRLEELKAQRMGFTLAQQWRTQDYGFRAGVGVLYQVVDGIDFDDEKISDARFLPTGDFDFFVLF